MTALARWFIPHILVAIATFVVAVVAHAAVTVDPADITISHVAAPSADHIAPGAASAAGAIAANATLSSPEVPQTAKDAGVFLGIAAALGVFLRVVAIPLLKLAGFFKAVPLPIQHVLIGILSAICGGCEAYGMGHGLIAALTAGAAAYAASQASYGLTAQLFEQRAPG
jgi:hypothetical protein